MNRLVLALAAASFAALLAIPAQADARMKAAGSSAGHDASRITDISSQRRWRHHRAHWGPRRVYWGPRYRYWGPRPVYWAQPRYWAPRPVYWGGPVISVGFGPRWWW